MSKCLKGEAGKRKVKKKKSCYLVMASQISRHLTTALSWMAARVNKDCPTQIERRSLLHRVQWSRELMSIGDVSDGADGV